MRRWPRRKRARALANYLAMCEKLPQVAIEPGPGGMVMLPRESLVDIPPRPGDPPEMRRLLYDGWMEIVYVGKPARIYR